MSLNGTYTAPNGQNMTLTITDSNPSNGSMQCEIGFTGNDGSRQVARGPGRFRYVNSNSQPTGICFWVIQRGNASIDMTNFGFAGSAASTSPSGITLGGKMSNITPRGQISYEEFPFGTWTKS